MAGTCASELGTHCSDRGFLAMPIEDDAEPADWTAGRTASDKRGRGPTDVPPTRVQLGPVMATWCDAKIFFERRHGTDRCCEISHWLRAH